MMTTGTARRIRPSRASHRAWFASLDPDTKATVKANVEALIDEDDVAPAEAWDRVFDSAQTPTGDLLSEDGESLLSDAEACVQAQAELREHEAQIDELAARKASKQKATGQAIVDALNGNTAPLEQIVADVQADKASRTRSTNPRYVESQEIARRGEPRGAGEKVDDDTLDAWIRAERAADPALTRNQAEQISYWLERRAVGIDRFNKAWARVEATS